MKAGNQKWVSGGKGHANATWTKSIEFCKQAIRRIKELREALILGFAAELGAGLSPAMVRRAVNDAEALAWSTSYPTLFLPVLAEEKIASARRWSLHQQAVLERQRILAAGY